ncbi:hypothetical protein [Microvirga sp. Mcv34]|uniref:hypothetical protein n=1 Tax=Microvirga sp. Mcv34 TaxID=2926016 RepID=UPI0021C62911|nr:hypothetical protein [Microvirga sp. Mcv34]
MHRSKLGLIGMMGIGAMMAAAAMAPGIDIGSAPAGSGKRSQRGKRLPVEETPRLSRGEREGRKSARLKAKSRGAGRL